MKLTTLLSALRRCEQDLGFYGEVDEEPCGDKDCRLCKKVIRLKRLSSSIQRRIIKLVEKNEEQLQHAYDCGVADEFLATQECIKKSNAEEMADEWIAKAMYKDLATWPSGFENLRKAILQTVKDAYLAGGKELFDKTFKLGKNK